MPATLPPWLRVAVAMTAVGWGANHFAGLLAVYRIDGHSEAFISFAVGIYAAGLIPALLVTAVLGSRVGWRTSMLLAVTTSAASSVLLMAGAEHDPLLQAGRFVAGAATGVALAPGTAWLMATSALGGPGAGARRATVSLSLGFGGGPFVAGLIAQWAPAPAVTPYVVHLALSLPALVLLWPMTAPTAGRHDDAGRGWSGVAATLRAPGFLPAVPLTAPWVFGTAAASFAIAPSLVTVTHLPIATGAGVIGCTLLSGVLIQPAAKRLEHRAPGRGLSVGMVLAVVGLGLIVAVVRTEAVWLLFPTALVLGAAYGVLLVGGLSRIELLADPADRARVNAVFYALTYLGFATPFLFVLLTDHLLAATPLLLVGIGIGAATLAVVALRPTPAQISFS